MEHILTKRPQALHGVLSTIVPVPYRKAWYFCTKSVVRESIGYDNNTFRDLGKLAKFRREIHFHLTQMKNRCVSVYFILNGGSPVVPDPGLEALEPLPPVLVYHHLVHA
jgi:hypothetical protein